MSIKAECICNRLAPNKEDKMVAVPLRKIIIAISSMALLLLITSDSLAFDKERKGFLLGFGIGAGYASYTDAVDISGKEAFSETKTGFGFATDFKMGYAPSNKLMVYWLSKVIWIGKKFADEDTLVLRTNESITAITAVGGLGLTYYLKPEAPSAFVTLGVGLSAWSYPFQDVDPWTGPGIAGGIGYEFATNWSIEASVLWGKPTDEKVDYKYNADFLSAGVTINVMGY
jgi:hypothetical protein